MFNGLSLAFIPWKVRSVTKREGSSPIIFQDEFAGNKELSEVIKYMLIWKAADRKIVKLEIRRRHY